MTETPSVVLFGYHEVGSACLQLLIARKVPVVELFTHADDPQEAIWFQTPAALAQAHGIPVFTPENPNTPEWRERLRALRPQLLLSCYYRRMLGAELLGLCPLGAFNMHGSLLPKYRGRSPVNWAILKGEAETGATLHVMTARPDAGAIVDQERVVIGPEDTARDVFARVSAAARSVLARTLDALLEGKPPLRSQDESQASYYGGRSPEDGRIDWRLPAAQIFNLIRAVTHPYPGAFTVV
ncbi:MAG TPA: formyltransferase, partial [Acidiferrobacteraceae bacterium]|nr:formyltransferase [Acidiferrobacteraceae bacterium]